MGQFEGRGTEIKHSEEFLFFLLVCVVLGLFLPVESPGLALLWGPAQTQQTWRGWANCFSHWASCFSHNPEKNDKVKSKIIILWFGPVPLAMCEVMGELKRVAVGGKVKTLKIPISFLLGSSFAQGQQLLLGHSFCWLPS